MGGYCIEDIIFESCARSKSSSFVLLMAFLIRETRLWFDAGGSLLADLLMLTMDAALLYAP